MMLQREAKDWKVRFTLGPSSETLLTTNRAKTTTPFSACPSTAGAQPPT